MPSLPIRDLNAATASSKLRRTEVALVYISALLLVVWPLPETILIRNLLLLSGLGFALAVCRSHWSELCSREAWPIWLLPTFFIWLLLHCFAFPSLPEEQLYDLTGDWARSACACTMGLALGFCMSNSNPASEAEKTQNTHVLIFGLAGTVFLYCCRYIYEVIATGVWLHPDFYEYPYHGKTAIVVFGGLLLVALYTKLSEPLEVGAWKWRNSLLLGGIAATLAAFYCSNTKNGFIVFVACTLLFLLRLLGRKHKLARPMPKTLLLAVLAGVLLFYSVQAHWQSNPAWSGMLENTQLCANIDGFDYWKDASRFPIPMKKSGAPVDVSTCERVAWANAGLLLIKENPLGYGLINHSFGALAIGKWPDFMKPAGKTRGATHSGLIDFTLGFGLPGLGLVMLALAMAFLRARKQSGFWYTYVLWAVPLTVLIYTVTEVCTGHFIELLFFTTAFYLSLTLAKKLPNATP